MPNPNPTDPTPDERLSEERIEKALRICDYASKNHWILTEWGNAATKLEARAALTELRSLRRQLAEQGDEAALTEEWLRSVGFVHLDEGIFSIENSSKQHVFVWLDKGEGVTVNFGDTETRSPLASCGQLVSLCRALNIPLRQAADEIEGIAKGGG